LIWVIQKEADLCAFYGFYGLSYAKKRAASQQENIFRRSMKHRGYYRAEELKFSPVVQKMEPLTKKSMR